MKKFKSKTIKKVVAVAMAVAVTAVSVPNFFEKMTVEASASAVNFDEENIAMSFAVLSDLHLHKSSVATATNVQAQVQRYANAVATLNQMAVNNNKDDEGDGLDMLLLAGDYGDTGTEVEGRAFASATAGILDQLKEVNGKEAGAILAYGNHETETTSSSAMTYEQWENVLREEQYGLAATAKDANDAYVPWGCNHETVVKTVDGEEKTYHFFSLELYSYDSNFIRQDALNWLDAELAAATTADPDAYVYLACHAPTRESGVYGADENFDTFFWWGSTKDSHRDTRNDIELSGALHSVLKNYPQVVHFSGHYHYTNLLESTIMSNGYYTAVAMAALSDSAIAQSNSPHHGYQDTVSTYNKAQVNHGYGLLVEVDKGGNQRMTRLEIDKDCSNMVVANVTYEANDVGTTIAEDKYTDTVVFSVNNTVQPTTLTPWVMKAPAEDKSHLDTYSQATRKDTPVFPEGAKLALENMVINEDDSITFDITYDTVGAKTADTNWVIRYELELYNQDGKLLNAGKEVLRKKDDRTANIRVRKDSIWMLGNFAANTDGVVAGTSHLDATKLTYPYSLSAEDLSGVTGIYAKLYAVDEFGGKSEALTCGSRGELINVGRLIKNGGFENGDLTNWTAGDTYSTTVESATVKVPNHKVVDTKAQSGTYSMEITRVDTTKKRIRTDIGSISPKTEYKLTYAINTEVSSAVEAIVYEYTFNNKIVGEHRVEVYGVTSGWKQAELVFTTSEAADKLGLVLVAKGSAGVVYVDDVAMIANGPEITQTSYDDANGDWVFDIKDIVRMQKALGKGTQELASAKYADRNGDGEFTQDDVTTLCKKLLGEQDDFGGVLATSGYVEAFGATLQPSSVVSGYAHVATSQEYDDETFTFTQIFESPIAIGVRMQGAYANINSAKEGVLLHITTNPYFGVYANGWGYNGGLSAQFWSYPGSARLTLGEKYVFSVQVIDNVADGTATVRVEARKDSALVAYGTVTLTAEQVTAQLPKQGKFVVWNLLGKTTDLQYQVIPSEMETRVEIDAQDARDGVVEFGKQHYDDGDIGVFGLKGNYTTEHFRFTTQFDEVIAGQKLLSVGLHKEDIDEYEAMKTGLYVRLTDKGWTIFGSVNNVTMEQKSIDYGATLESNKEYTFDFHVEDHTVYLNLYGSNSSLLSSTSITLTGKDSSGVEYTWRDSGMFQIWSWQETTKIAWDMPEKDLGVVEVDADATAGSAMLVNKNPGVLANSAYVVTKKTYTTEAMEFTTELQEIDTIILGARMSGKAHDPATHSGLYIRFTENGTGYTVYNKGTAVKTGSFTTALVAGTEYTFRLGINGKQLRLDVISDGVTVNYAIIDVSASTVPSAGYFMVWSMDEYHTIEYSTPITGGAVITVPSDGKAGTVVLNGTSTLSTGHNPYLLIDGDYTTETFTFKTVFRDLADYTGNNGIMLIGARRTETVNYFQSGTGLVIQIGKGSLRVYQDDSIGNYTCISYGNTWTAADYIQPGVEHTISVTVANNSVRLQITGGKQDLDRTLKPDNAAYTEIWNTRVAKSGDFAVWSYYNEGQKISYEMPVLTGTSVVTNKTSGTVRLEKPASNMASLTVDGNFSTEALKFTTTIDDAANPGLRVTLRASNTSTLWNQTTKGVNVNLGASTIQAYCLNTKADTDVSHAGPPNVYYGTWNPSDVLVSGKEHTFTISIQEDAIFLQIEREGQVVFTRTLTPSNDTHELHWPHTKSIVGDFIIWSSNSTQTIKYEVIENETE